METMLEEFGCYTDFIPLEEGLTRINVKVKSNEQSEINGQGPGYYRYSDRGTLSETG